LRINIKIPKNIFGEKYGYSLEGLQKELQNDQGENFRAGLRLKSSDGCLDIKRCVGNGLEINDYCGWIIISIYYKVGLNTDGTDGEDNDGNPEEICNLCEISYSICFDPVKVKALYGQCDDHVEENVEFPMETCLELTNNRAKRRYSEPNDNNTFIEGPENFLCVVIGDTSEPVSWDKFNKTLTVPSNVEQSDLNAINANIKNVEDQFVVSPTTGGSFSETNGAARTEYSQTGQSGCIQSAMMVRLFWLCLRVHFPCSLRQEPLGSNLRLWVKLQS
jgi:hypothetical protein